MLLGESSWDVCQDSVCSLICLLKYFQSLPFSLDNYLKSVADESVGDPRLRLSGLRVVRGQLSSWGSQGCPMGQGGVDREKRAVLTSRMERRCNELPAERFG